MNIKSVPLLNVEGLTIDFWDRNNWINIVNNVTFSVISGETLGLAGESGCGKTTTAYSLFGYHRPGSLIRRGKILFNGQDLLSTRKRNLNNIRGRRIALIPQNPATSLTPTMRVGDQIVETIQVHKACSSHNDAKSQTLSLLEDVGLTNSKVIANSYAHQLSGGQRQRVMIALALSCNPSLLVLDEPTSALDVVFQARIIELLMKLRTEYHMSMVYVTHDLGVLAQICSRVAVMYAGELVEIAPTQIFFHEPLHPYSKGLIDSVPLLFEKKDTGSGMKGLLRRDEIPEGCRFAPRCNQAKPICFTQPQSLAKITDDHYVACCLIHNFRA